MRVTGVVVALALVALGAIWLGQGLGYIKGSFMTGQPTWVWIGAAVVLLGAAIGGVSVIRGRAR